MLREVEAFVGDEAWRENGTSSILKAKRKTNPHRLFYVALPISKGPHTLPAVLLL
jgi:hypothetical protein